MSHVRAQNSQGTLNESETVSQIAADTDTTLVHCGADVTDVVSIVNQCRLMIVVSAWHSFLPQLQ